MELRRQFPEDKSKLPGKFKLNLTSRQHILLCVYKIPGHGQPRITHQLCSPELIVWREAHGIF